MILIAPLETWNASHGFGFAMVMRTAMMVVMSLMRHAVCVFNICRLILWFSLWLYISAAWNCLDGSFKCPTGRPTCINFELLCDSNKYLHCHDGIDEKSCGMYTKPCFHTCIKCMHKQKFSHFGGNLLLFISQGYVEETSLFQLDTCLLHPTRAITQQMQTASILSHSPLALLLSWILWGWALSF